MDGRKNKNRFTRESANHYMRDVIPTEEEVELSRKFIEKMGYKYDDIFTIHEQFCHRWGLPIE